MNKKIFYSIATIFSAASLAVANLAAAEISIQVEKNPVALNKVISSKYTTNLDSDGTIRITHSNGIICLLLNTPKDKSTLWLLAGFGSVKDRMQMLQKINSFNDAYPMVRFSIDEKNRVSADYRIVCSGGINRKNLLDAVDLFCQYCKIWLEQNSEKAMPKTSGNSTLSDQEGAVILVISKFRRLMLTDPKNAYKSFFASGYADISYKMYCEFPENYEMRWALSKFKIQKVEFSNDGKNATAYWTFINPKGMLRNCQTSLLKEGNEWKITDTF